MARPPIFEWHAKGYASDEKSADWYWALGIVGIALIIVCVLFNNALLALVVLAAGIAIALQAAKRPRIHRFAIIDTGILIDNHLYKYDDMLHFSVLEYLDETVPPALSIKTRHFLAPHLLIPIVDHDPIAIYEYMSLHLTEGKHDESAMDRIVEMLQL